ncbi:cytochrome c-type biogenesis protein CcmH [Thermus sp.]|uniref:cytochrome c-type biogenesis protein n=1 Tax=Thermus sp. TaxID=275 RepID=UPI00307CDCB6
MRLFLFLLLFWTGALAQEAAPPPDLPPEVFQIARTLRCPVCQGESAAESNSGVAVEMRRLIAEMLKEGKTPEEIKAFFVDRYGDWILYEPPRRGLTLWAWVLPLVALALLALGLFAYFRPRPLPKELLEEAERRMKEPPA